MPKEKRSQVDPTYDVEVVIDRLRHCQRRITHAVALARAGNEVWRTFNRLADRQVVADSPASQAAFVYERSTLDAQILMVSRVFDVPGRGHVMSQNRMSFPVCRALLLLPGVEDALLKWAEETHPDGPQYRDRIADRQRTFLGRLKTLETEEPNRIALIRAFRDENIAHELRFDVLPPRPRYDHVHSLIVEASALCELFATAVSGEIIQWQDATLGDSARWLWNAVARQHEATVWTED